MRTLWLKGYKIGQTILVRQCCRQEIAVFSISFFGSLAWIAVMCNLTRHFCSYPLWPNYLCKTCPICLDLYTFHRTVFTNNNSGVRGESSSFLSTLTFKCFPGEIAAKQCGVLVRADRSGWVADLSFLRLGGCADHCERSQGPAW